MSKPRNFFHLLACAALAALLFSCDTGRVSPPSPDEGGKPGIRHGYPVETVKQSNA